MRDPFLAHLRSTLDQIRADGFHKTERVIASQQSSDIQLENGADVLNFCANNYLGLANDARLIAAAKDGLDKDGFGMASVRFICGTQTVHKELERALSAFLKTDDCILYSSCFDANGGLFETLLDDSDAIISDELNHASIIDGVRLSKARRLRYKNNDLADLEVAGPNVKIELRNVCVVVQPRVEQHHGMHDFVSVSNFSRDVSNLGDVGFTNPFLRCLCELIAQQS